MSEQFSQYARTRKEAKARGDKHYFPGKPCSNGHISLRVTSSYCCRECATEWARKKRATDPEYLERQRAYCRENNRKRYHNDPEYARKVKSAATVRWRKRYRSDPAFRAYNIQRHRKRYRNDPEFRERCLSSLRECRKRKVATPEGKAHEAWRTLIKRCVKAGWAKQHSTADELGYSPEDLRAHLESLFHPGMNWENYGSWHIDHIRPISSFPPNTPPSVVNALSNLRPLWASDNQSKGAKWGQKHRPHSPLSD